MDLYHHKALNKTKAHHPSVFTRLCGYMCANAGKTVVSLSFMNGKQAFVISSPYLVTIAVLRESFVYAAWNKTWQ